jgi:hypothetical protein
VFYYDLITLKDFCALHSSPRIIFACNGKLSAETCKNFSKWISTEYHNEVLFDLIASDLLGVFPNKKLFLESKQDIYKFIIESLPIEVQNLYNKKFPCKITDEDIKPRKEKKNLLSRLYRLFLKLSNKLYGSDLNSFVIPNDTIDDDTVSRPSSQCKFQVKMMKRVSNL